MDDRWRDERRGRGGNRGRHRTSGYGRDYGPANVEMPDEGYGPAYGKDHGRHRSGRASRDNQDEWDQEGFSDRYREEDAVRRGYARSGGGTGGYYGEFDRGGRDARADYGRDNGSPGFRREYEAYQRDVGAPNRAYGRSTDFGAGRYGAAGGYGGYGERSHGYPRDRRDYSARNFHGGEERGWLDRAGDEVRSWFGDEDAERRREMDQYRGHGPKGYRRSDERIREDVCDRLCDDPYLDASDIEVDVRAGEIILSGHVRARMDKRRAEDCAEDISGVRHVQNNLRVQPAGGALPATEGVSSGTSAPTIGASAGGTIATGTQPTPKAPSL